MKTATEYYQQYLSRKSHWERLNEQALAETKKIIREKVRHTDSDDAHDEYNSGWGNAPANGWNL